MNEALTKRCNAKKRGHVCVLDPPHPSADKEHTHKCFCKEEWENVQQG